MIRIRSWFWIPMVLLAALAGAGPAALRSGPVTAGQSSPTLGMAGAIASRTAPSESTSEFWSDQSHTNNLALCAATGFAGGFTVFLLISGFGILRVAMPRDFAICALICSTATSFAGFALGFTGFLQIVGS